MAVFCGMTEIMPHSKNILMIPQRYKSCGKISFRLPCIT